MDSGAHVRSVQAIEQWRGSLKQFAGETLDSLRAAERELQRTEEWLQQDLRRRHRNLETCREEVNEARSALRQCQEEDDADCSQEEEDLARAWARLRWAEEGLATHTRWMRSVEEAAARYRAQAQRLGMSLNVEMPRATVALEQALERLYAYLGTTGLAGVPTASIAAPPQTRETKAQAIRELPPPIGLQYTQQMRERLTTLSWLDDADFAAMLGFMRSEEHKPAFFDNEQDADTLLQREFRKSWKPGASGEFPVHPSMDSDRPHRVIVGTAREQEDTLLHELAHQLSIMAWQVTGSGGQSKRATLERLYATIPDRKAEPVRENAHDNEWEYFAYSFEWFVTGEQKRLRLKKRDPEMHDFLNTQVLPGMYP
jgi:hypothetical protein